MKGNPDRVVGIYPETKHPTWHDSLQLACTNGTSFSTLLLQVPITPLLLLAVLPAFFHLYPPHSHSLTQLTHSLTHSFAKLPTKCLLFSQATMCYLLKKAGWCAGGITTACFCWPVVHLLLTCHVALCRRWRPTTTQDPTTALPGWHNLSSFSHLRYAVLCCIWPFF